MKHSNKHTHSLTRSLGLLGLLGALALPSVSAAAPPTVEQAPHLAATDAPCEQAVIALQLDVVSGLVYLVEGTVLTLIDDDELNIYFGQMMTVVVDLEFTAASTITRRGCPRARSFTRSSGSARERGPSRRPSPADEGPLLA